MWESQRQELLYSGNIKSAVGLGIILSSGNRRYDPCFSDGCIRWKKSNPRNESLRHLDCVREALKSFPVRPVDSTRIDLIGLANQVEAMVQDIPLDIKVAVMGCVVNGPGEAKEADIGIAGGVGVGLLIKKGEIVKKVPEEQLLDTLREELLHWEA